MQLCRWRERYSSTLPFGPTLFEDEQRQTRRASSCGWVAGPLIVPSRNPRDLGSFEFRLSVTASPTRESPYDSFFGPGQLPATWATLPVDCVGSVVSGLRTGCDLMGLSWPSASRRDQVGCGLCRQFSTTPSDIASVLTNSCYHALRCKGADSKQYWLASQQENMR